LGGVLTAFLMLTPLITATGRTLSRSPEKVASWCGKDMKAMILDLGRSSPFLRIMAPGTRTFVPNVAEDKFLQDKTFGGIGIADKLGTLRQGDLLVLAYDISGFDVGDDMPLWLVVPKARFLKLPAQYRACATEESISTEWGDIPVFTARTVERVSN
jgi:hypothetical protein